jgi:hypothetical protein
MRFKEIDTASKIAKIRNFVDFAVEYLGLQQAPTINLVDDQKEAVKNRSFGGYSLDDGCIRVNIAGRHPADVMRTLAHELVHYGQDLTKEGGLVAQDGQTGTPYENEANAVSGKIMRAYARMNPAIFEAKAPR